MKKNTRRRPTQKPSVASQFFLGEIERASIAITS